MWGDADDFGEWVPLDSPQNGRHNGLYYGLAMNSCQTAFWLTGKCQSEPMRRLYGIFRPYFLGLSRLLYSCLRLSSQPSFAFSVGVVLYPAEHPPIPLLIDKHNNKAWNTSIQWPYLIEKKHNICKTYPKLNFDFTGPGETLWTKKSNIQRWCILPLGCFNHLLIGLDII